MTSKINKIIRLIFFGIFWVKIIFFFFMAPFPISMIGLTEIISIVVVVSLTVFNFYSYKYINLINMVFLLLWTFGLIDYTPNVEMSASVSPDRSFDISIGFNPIVFILVICYFMLNSIYVINEFKSLEYE